MHCHRFRLIANLVVATALVSAAQAQDNPISRIGVGSCMSQENPQPIWDAVLTLKPELFILLGDNIYGDTDNPEVLRRKYETLGGQLGFAKLRTSSRVFAMWDDHDFGGEDIGAENPIKEESRKAFLEFFKEPADSPRWKRKGIYGSMSFGPTGKRLQVILLDTRFNRSKLKKEGRAYQPDPDPANTFLGEDQWKWLGEQLRIPADIRLIGSSIQVVAEDHPFEKWANFPNERDKLFHLIREANATGVIFLSGDRHLGELSLNETGVGYPIYDLTSSGLNMAAKRWRGIEVNQRRVATMTHGDNFGMVLIDWEREDPLIRLQLRDVDGEVVVQQKVLLSQLKPKPKPQPVVVSQQPKTDSPTKPATTPTGVMSPAEASKHVDEQVTVEFVVQGTGSTRDNSRVFLNSSDRREKDNFTIVLEMKKLGEGLKAAGVEDPKAFYKGKTIRVSGKVSLFNNAPQIVLDSVKQIEVVNK